MLCSVLFFKPQLNFKGWVLFEKKKIVDARNLICCTSNKTASKKVHFYNSTRDSFGMKKKSFRNCQQFHVFGKFWWSLNIIWIFKQTSRTSKPNQEGSLGFWKNSFEGGTWGCQKIYRGPLFHVLLHFYGQTFRTLRPLPPPHSVHLCSKLYSNGVRCSYVH